MSKSNNQAMLTGLFLTLTATAFGLMPTLTLTARAASNLPTSGKVVSLTNGDLMCYVKLEDQRGVRHDLGADFELCNNNKFLNQKVSLTYKRTQVSDCQSAEPCGKSRWVNLITKMTIVK
jgi:hypothetical protein